jgi:hypothetical protein
MRIKVTVVAESISRIEDSIEVSAEMLTDPTAEAIRSVADRAVARAVAAVEQLDVSA